jgi:hypothetical protein
MAEVLQILRRDEMVNDGAAASCQYLSVTVMGNAYAVSIGSDMLSLQDAISSVNTTAKCKFLH